MKDKTLGRIRGFIVKSKVNTLYLLKRFILYFGKYRYILAFDLFCASLTTVCEMVLPIMMRTITNKGMEDITLLTADYILKLGGLYLVLRLIDAAANYYMANVGHVMGARIETDMRRDAFEHLTKLSDNFYNDTKIGQIMARITNDLFEVTEFAHHCPEEFFIAGIKLIVSFCILVNINVVLTLVIFAVIPFMALFSSRFNHKMRTEFKAQRNHIGELNSNIEDSLLGIKVVKAFANEELERAKFEVGNQTFLEIKKRTYKYLAGFQCSNRLFDGLMYIIILVGGGFLMMKESINPGDMVAYIMFVSTLLNTIRRIIEFTEQFQRGMTGIERFIEIMDSEVDIKDKEGAEKLENVIGNISFKNVSFGYNDDNTKVLDNINIDIKSGEKIALVGSSGGGKTTFCNLIPRFYEATKGSISIDGKDIKDITINSLRKNIGIVQQDVYLFSGTVYENIAYGKLGASKEEVIEAAKLAGADEFIKELTNQYDSYVGERGVKLSGGQKQRISIARVFLKNPAILILDEATSALDNESEYLVSQSLERLSKGRTTITIAHRLSTIRNAERILVLSGNQIAEEGTHEELLAVKGIYYNLNDTAGRCDKLESIAEK